MQTEHKPSADESAQSKTTDAVDQPMVKPVADRTGSGSRVQFDANVKESAPQQLASGQGGRAAKKKRRRSFRDIVLEEIIANMDNDGQQLTTKPPKGILKVRSEPALGAQEGDNSSLSFVNQAYEADSGEEANNFKVKAKRAFSKASLAGSSGFADVVGLVIQRSSLDMGGRDAHPFGRDCSIEGILQASRPKSHSKNSAFSKLMIWMTAICFLFGLACGVIFLSETYNAAQRERATVRLQVENGTGNQ